MSAELEYRVAELERKQNRMICHGTIAEIDGKKAKVKVTYAIHNDKPVNTGWLDWGVLRAGPDREWRMPEVQEQVTILSPSGDMAQGIVMLGLPQDLFPPKADDPDIYRMDFKNGSYIRHDRKSGDMELVATGTLWLNGETVKLNDPAFKKKDFN